MPIRSAPAPDQYEQIAAPPDGLTWRPHVGGPSHTVTTLYSIGNYYKLIRVRDTGAVTYFKLKDDGPPATPKDQIDAEPTKAGQVRFRKGTLCWFVDAGGIWYLVNVADRQPGRIVIRSETGFDVDRKTAWPHGDLLEFPCKENNPLFMRLRPLKARYR